MDIANLKTFLAVEEAGSFVGAAKRVHVTQSTVSMRIKSLEDEIGAQLFERNKGGAVLTAHGREFSKHALAMARIWDQARLEIGLGIEQRALLRVGGQLSLWSGYLVDWMTWMKSEVPDVSIASEVGHIDALTQHLADGSLDMAVMYRPQVRSGYDIQHLFDDEMILVASPAAADPLFGEDYVFVNWGPDFQKDHVLIYPEEGLPRVSLDLGAIGVDYLIKARAAGYFPRRTVAHYVRDGSLTELTEAPSLSYPVFGVFPRVLDPELVGTAMTGLREVAGTFGR